MKVLLHMPHISLRLPISFYKGLQISKNEINKYNLTMSDVGIDTLFKDVKGYRISPKFSRLYCDVEKYKNEPAIRAEAMFFAAFYLKEQGTDESKKQAYGILNSLYTDYPDSKWTKMWLGWIPQRKIARKK